MADVEQVEDLLDQFDSHMEDIENADNVDEAVTAFTQADSVLGELASEFGLPLDGNSGYTEEEFRDRATDENGNLYMADVAELFQKMHDKRDQILEHGGYPKP